MLAAQTYLQLWTGGLVAVTLLLTTAACATISFPSPQPSVRGYLAEGSTYVDFLQLTRSSDNLSGSLLTNTVQGTTVSSLSLPFTGIAQGNQISLTFNAGLGVTTNVTGHYNRDHVLLFVPQRSGELQAVDMAPADATNYNGALAHLKDQTTHDQETAATPTPEPPTTPASKPQLPPEQSPSGSGQNWDCLPASAAPPNSAQRSTFCPTGWRVPDGSFQPFEHCHAIIYNVVRLDGPQSPGYRTALFDANWNPIPEGAC
jgi:hypothetical protein